MHIEPASRARIVAWARGALLGALLGGCEEEGGDTADQAAPPPAPPAASAAADLEEAAFAPPPPPPPPAPRRGLGTMTARVPGTTAVVPGVRLVAHRVRAVVQEGFARTEIEEEWANETSQVLEGRFVFPVPAGAAVSRLALWVGTDLIEGEVLERGRASRIFRGIVEDTVRPRDPALLEWVRGGELSMTIFPIPARGSRKVVLAYDQQLEERAGDRRWVHALSLGADRATSIRDFAVSVRVVGDPAATSIETPGWAAEHRDGEGETTITLAATDLVPERDVVIELGAVASAGRGEDTVVALSAPERERTFFAARLVVPVSAAPPAGRADRVVVLDTSESQDAETLDAQRRAAGRAIAALGEGASFAVLGCDTACATFPARGRVHATAESRAALATFLAELRPRGASDLAGAIATGAMRLDEGGQLVVLHDGQTSAGELEVERIADRIQPELEVRGVDLRLVGAGRTVDAVVLGGLARAVGAAFDPLDGPGSVGERIDALVAGLARPVLRDAHLVLPPGFHDVVPATLPSLRTGDAITLLGTVDDDAAGGVATITGFVEGEPIEVVIPLRVAREQPTNPLLPKLWADRAIADLESQGGPDTRARIVALSRGYHVLSRHTALLVLESERMFADFGVERTTVRPGDQADHTFGSLGAGAPLPESTPESAPATGASGALGGGHRTRAPSIRMGQTSVSGRLPPEIVQRIVRQQLGRFRACYERGLQKNPELAGRVAARFVISRDGFVRSTSDAGSDLPDPEVVACVVRSFGALQFPQPEGGIVTVTYPIVFASDGTRPQAPTALWPAPPPPPPIAPVRLAPPAPSPVAPWQSPVTIHVTHAPGDELWRAAREPELARLEQAADAAPASRTRRERWIRALLMQGRWQRAADEAGRFVEMDPDLPLARELLASASGAVGDRDTALASIEALAEAQGRGVDAHLRAARALDAAAETVRACAHHRTLAELRPTEAARSRAAQCWALLQEQAAPVPSREADERNAEKEHGAFVATVHCTDAALVCPQIAVVTPTGRVVSRAAPFGAAPVEGGIALSAAGAGRYRTVLLGGDGAAQGTVRVRAHGSAREVAFAGAGLRTVLTTSIEERTRAMVRY